MIDRYLKKHAANLSLYLCAFVTFYIIFMESSLALYDMGDLLRRNDSSIEKTCRLKLIKS